METVGRAATKDDAAYPSRRLPDQANADPQVYPGNAARLFAVNHRAEYYTLPRMPPGAQKDSDLAVNYDRREGVATGQIPKPGFPKTTEGTGGR
jgi:hypothetical protein